MPYDKLLQQRRIRPYQARPQEVAQLLQLAARDLATAEKLLGEDVDWAFNIVYNAILQAMRALMLHEGFIAPSSSLPRRPSVRRTSARWISLIRCGASATAWCTR